MTQVDIFVGSQCNGNPGHGGWAAVLCVGRHEKVLSGGEPGVTINRMDLLALTEALRVLIEPCTVTVHSTSRFLADGFARWSGIWEPRGWSSGRARPVNNADQWYALITLAQAHALTFATIAGDDCPAMAQALRLAGEAA